MGQGDFDIKMAETAELVEHAKLGCQRSYGEIVERHWQRLFHFLRSKTASLEDAEDLTQDAFAKAYQNLGRYRDVYAFNTWLYTIAIRLAYSHHRRDRAMPLIVQDVQDDRANVLDEMIEQEQERILWQSAKSLPAGQYDVLWLRYAEGMDIRQISEAVGKTQIHVRVLLHRARKRLGQVIMQQEVKVKSEMPSKR